MKTECFKLEAPELAKKTLYLVYQVAPTSPQICKKYMQKPRSQGARDDRTFWG